MVKNVLKMIRWPDHYTIRGSHAPEV